MSTELKILEERKKRLLENLKFVEDSIEKEKIRIKKIKKEVRCPKCKSNNWRIYSSHNPFKKKAFEKRTMRICCINCGFEWVEEVGISLMRF